jgi:hypothetical protein
VPQAVFAVEVHFAGGNEVVAAEHPERARVRQGGDGGQAVESVAVAGQLTDPTDRGCRDAAARRVLGEPEAEFGLAVGDVEQVEAAEDGAFLVDQDVEVMLAGLLVREQGRVAASEVGEIVVAAIGDEAREVGPVRTLETQQGGGVVRVEALQFGHRAIVNVNGGHRNVITCPA